MKRGVEFRVGVFVIVAIAVLIFGFYWLGNYRIGRTGYRLTVHFSDVGGLRVGDPTQIAGVQKGKVGKIELKGELVKVILVLDKDAQLNSDCRILIRDVAMISGTKYVKVEPGSSGTPLDISKPVIGISPPDFSISDLQSVASRLSQIFDKLATHLVTEEAVRSVKETIDNITHLTRELNHLVSETKTDFTEGVRDLRAVSLQVKEFISSEEFSSTLKSLRDLSDRLEEMSEGEGTLGKLIRDEDLYNELIETTRTARELLEDIKANPKKYVKISIF